MFNKLARPEQRMLAVANREPATVAGRGCSGPREHRRRFWLVDANRLLHLREADGAKLPETLCEALRVPRPVPGRAQVMACDPFALAVVLNDASIWRLDTRASFDWRAQNVEAKQAEGKVTEHGKEAPPVLIAAGHSCGTLWYVDAARHAWSWSLAAGRRPVGGAPLPGAESVAGVDVTGRTVVMANGTRWAWVGGRRWYQLGGLADSDPGTVRVRVVSGIISAVGHLAEGDIREVPEAVARELFTIGAAVDALDTQS